MKWWLLIIKDANEFLLTRMRFMLLLSCYYWFIYNGILPYSCVSKFGVERLEDFVYSFPLSL